MKKRNNKKAEGVLGIGFGTMFSIFLIIIFIIIAIYAITKFLDATDCSKEGLFTQDLQQKINSAFNSQTTNATFSANLPSKIDYVCFGNMTSEFKGNFAEVGEDLSIYEGRDANLFFYPREKSCIKTKQILHLDMDNMLKKNNPFCIPVVNGKIIIKVSKGFNKGTVTLSY